MSGNALNNARYVAAANALLMMARVLADSKDDIEWALTTIAHAHAMMPVLDPTAYREHSQNLTDQAEIFRPLYEAAKTLEPILARHTAAMRIG